MRLKHRIIKNAMLKASVLTSLFGCLMGVMYDAFTTHESGRPGLAMFIICMTWLGIFTYANFRREKR